MTLDKNYFQGELFIYGLEKPDVSENIAWFISKYEKQWLLKLLGKTLYDDYISNPTKESNVTLKAYLFDEENKQSYCANYVYFFFVRNSATKASSIGEIIESRDGETRVNAIDKLTKAYNDMVTWIKTDFADWIEENAAAYPDIETEKFSYINEYGI